MHLPAEAAETLNVTARCSALSQTLKRVSCFRRESRIIRYTLLPQRPTTLSLIDCEAIWPLDVRAKIEKLWQPEPSHGVLHAARSGIRPNLGSIGVKLLAMLLLVLFSAIPGGAMPKMLCLDLQRERIAKQQRVGRGARQPMSAGSLPERRLRRVRSLLREPIVIWPACRGTRARLCARKNRKDRRERQNRWRNRLRTRSSSTSTNPRNK